jgi:1-deoxy-D-xylulose-5-phosphate reductoisomerase
MAPKRISILGSTGSIGRQALDVIANFPQRFKVTGISAGENIELLAHQARKFGVRTVSVRNEDKARDLKKLLPGSVKIYCGEEGLDHLAETPDADLILMAVVGSAGLKPLVRAIKARKSIALANKEPMVMAGKIITKLAKTDGVKLIPVDSIRRSIPA